MDAETRVTLHNVLTSLSQAAAAYAAHVMRQSPPSRRTLRGYRAELRHMLTLIDDLLDE